MASISRRFRAEFSAFGRVWGHPGAPAWTYVGVKWHRKVKRPPEFPAKLQGGCTEGTTIIKPEEYTVIWTHCGGELVTRALKPAIRYPKVEAGVARRCR